ncbi:MAG: M23 family metallopeptidase [Saprospiraceae bacterium]
MKVHTTLIFLFFLLNISSQELYVIDTLLQGNEKIIVFSDNSFQYLENLDSNNTYQNINDLYKGDILDTNKLFKRYWSNEAVHVRYKNLYFLKDSLTIFLADEKKSTLPCQGNKTSSFGPRWGKMHKGIDFSLRGNDTVINVFSGRVRYAKYNSGGYGNLVIVRHYNGLETYYAHLSGIEVKVNQEVKAGQFIGHIGSTGHSTGPHLHFECRFMGNAIDPELLINFSTGNLVSSAFVIKSKLFKYQASGVSEEIVHDDLIYKKNKEKQIDEKLKDAKSGKRKKNPDQYNGNM